MTITLTAPELTAFAQRLLIAAGTPPGPAERVAQALVESNLVGHDSHGVLRLPQYVEAIEAGLLNPAGEVSVVRERPATALLDGGWTFGQVAAQRGMQLAIDKAAVCGVGTVALRHCDHTGRIGEYAVMAAQQGYIGQVVCNGSLPGGLVAPYGGRRHALGANPLAWALPNGTAEPIFLDFATAIVAHGKLQVAADKNEDVPLGWILDKHGVPTTRPQDQFDDGAILPFGAHKGYAMSVMIEAIGGALAGAGFPIQPNYRWDQGTLLIAIQVEAFQAPDEFARLVGELGQALKATPRAEGVDEILLPGELEWRTRAQRLRDGIALPDITWERLQAALKRQKADDGR
jgi:LDH2 family malate/lactate/ureidoglycolate dehydrogenase